MSLRRSGGRGGVLARWSQPSPHLVTAAFLASGVTHLVRPSVFEPLIPPALPRHRDIVYASGVAELVCAVGLLARARWAGAASAAVLVGVWPGNLQMALDVTGRARRRGLPAADVALAAVVWARMPLQILLIRAALAARPEASSTSDPTEPPAR